MAEQIIVRKLIKFGAKQRVYAVTGTTNALRAKQAVARLNKEPLSKANTYKAAIGVISKYNGQEAVWFEGDAKGTKCILVWKGAL